MTSPYILEILKTPPKTVRFNISINKIGKFAGYKINIKESAVFLYTNNKLFEREINKAISLTIVQKTIKPLRIYLIKKYTENYTTLMKD